jgi:hypothetical protein
MDGKTLIARFKRGAEEAFGLIKVWEARLSLRDDSDPESILF